MANPQVPTMSRDVLPPILASLIRQAGQIAEDVNCIAVIALADVTYDFKAIQERLKNTTVIVASPVTEVLDAARSDGVKLVPLIQEPQTRQVQISQALLEAI